MALNMPVYGLAPAAAMENLVQRSLLTAMETTRDARFRHELAWHYYQGDMYAWLRTQNGLEAEREKAGKHQELAAYFNPVREIVDVDVSKVFAPPIRGANLTPALDQRLNALWTRSKFIKLVRAYVQTGAAQGTVYLHVLDGPKARIKVRRADELDVLHHPQTGAVIVARQSMLVYDPLGLEADQDNPGVAHPNPGKQTYKYDFVMTPRWYGTFKDDKPWAFSDNPTDDAGRPMAQWPNVLGLVPIVPVTHAEDPDGAGVSAWEFTKGTIDAANQIATFMANTVKMHIDPLVVVYGVKAADFEKRLVNGQTNVFFITLPETSATGTSLPPKVETLEWQGNVSDVTGFIAWIKGCLVDVCPELQLARIQEQSNPSGYSVQLQSSRLSGHIEGLRANYFEGLVTADRLALWAEDVHTRALSPDAPSTYMVLDDELQYAHDIEAGPMLPPNLTEEVERASKMLADGVIDKLEYLLMQGLSLPEANAILARAKKEAEENQAAMLGMMQTSAEADALRGGNDDDEDQDPGRRNARTERQAAQLGA